MFLIFRGKFLLPAQYTRPTPLELPYTSKNRMMMWHYVIRREGS